MRALVTGCHGYIGGHLVEELLARGHDVVGVDHRPATWQAFDRLGPYRFAQLELNSRDAIAPLTKALENVEAVFHLASHQPFSWELAPFIYGNVDRTATLIEAMRLAGIKRLIHSSTFAVYGEAARVPIAESDPVSPQNIYEMTKYQAEMLVRVYSESSAFKASVLRYPSLYGGRNLVGALYYFIEQTMKGTPLRLFAGGRTIRDFVFIEDVVQANLSCLTFNQETPFEVFNIGGGDPISMRDLAHLIFELTGRETEIIFAEDPHWRGTDLYLDITKAQEHLHYRPRKMRDGVELFLKSLAPASEVASL